MRKLLILWLVKLLRVKVPCSVYEAIHLLFMEELKKRERTVASDDESIFASGVAFGMKATYNKILNLLRIKEA